MAARAGGERSAVADRQRFPADGGKWEMGCLWPGTAPSPLHCGCGWLGCAAAPVAHCAGAHAAPAGTSWAAAAVMVSAPHGWLELLSSCRIRARLWGRALLELPNSCSRAGGTGDPRPCSCLAELGLLSVLHPSCHSIAPPCIDPWLPRSRL